MDEQPIFGTTDGKVSNPSNIKIEKTLNERHPQNGEYSMMATTAQNIKDIMHGSPNWRALSGARKESLDCIATKLARILHGDPNYVDHYHDIAGYATLAELSIFPMEVKS